MERKKKFKGEDKEKEEKQAVRLNGKRLFNGKSHKGIEYITFNYNCNIFPSVKRYLYFPILNFTL